MFPLNLAVPYNMQTAVGLATVPLMIYSPTPLIPVASDLQNAAMAAAWFQSLPSPSVTSHTTSYRDIANGSFCPLVVPSGVISGRGSMPVCRSDVGFAAALQKLARHQRQAVIESSSTAAKSISTSQNDFETNFVDNVNQFTITERRLPSPTAAQLKFRVADCVPSGRRRDCYNNNVENVTQFGMKNDHPSDQSAEIHTSPHPVLSSSSSSSSAAISPTQTQTMLRSRKRHTDLRENYVPLTPVKTSPVLPTPVVKQPRLSPVRPPHSNSQKKLTSNCSRSVSQIRLITGADVRVSGISSISEEVGSLRNKSQRVRFHRPFETEHSDNNKSDVECYQKSLTYSDGHLQIQSVNLDLHAVAEARTAKPAEDDVIDGVRRLPYSQPASWSDYLQLLAGVVQCENGSHTIVDSDNCKLHRSNCSQRKCQIDSQGKDNSPVSGFGNSVNEKATSELRQSGHTSSCGSIPDSNYNNLVDCYAENDNSSFVADGCKEISFSSSMRPDSTENLPNSSDDSDAEVSSAGLHFGPKSTSSLSSDQTPGSVKDSSMHELHAEVVGCDDLISSIALPFRHADSNQPPETSVCNEQCNAQLRVPTFTNWPGVDRLLEAHELYRKEMKSEKQFLEKNAAKLQQRSRELIDSAEQLNSEHQELCSHVQFLRQCFKVDQKTSQSLTAILQSLASNL